MNRVAQMGMMKAFEGSGPSKLKNAMTTEFNRRNTQHEIYRRHPPIQSSNTQPGNIQSSNTQPGNTQPGTTRGNMFGGKRKKKRTKRKYKT
jgi:hypothetical protein